MINLMMLTKTEEILEETGLPSSSDLWDIGFKLDDWDVCFVSDVRLVEACEELDEDGFPLYDPEPIDEAYWIIRQMETYFCRYEEVEYNGKWYYTVYHS